VQWLLVDFLLDPLGAGSSRWTLVEDEGRAHDPRSRSLYIREDLRSIIVETGAMTFHVGKDGRPLIRVVVDGRDLVDPASTRVVLVDSRGREQALRIEEAALEARGPVRATVRLAGHFGGGDRCRCAARLDFFAGTGLARIRLTLHNPDRARHPGGLWDLGDPGSILFRDLSMVLGLEGMETPAIHWKAEVGQPLRAMIGGGLEIYQDSSGGENWNSRNHVNRSGRVPCSFRGYRMRAAEREGFGSRASPTVSLGGRDGRVTVAVPEFWQQFPKALEVAGRQLRIRLFPAQCADLFELQGGERKTHTLWLDFGPARPAPGPGLDWVHRPARVHATTDWYAGTGAIPDLTPASMPRVDRFESILDAAIAGEGSLFARREIIDEYGWRNFGDVYADHEATYYPGPPPVISHYNNQYDFVYGSLLQYVRTGRAAWFELADALARHVIDIDIYHTDRDRAAYNGGLFWHTDHYRDASTCTHRAYSRANRGPLGRSYGGGPGNEHNYTTGLLHYYFLTGDLDAREAVIGLADWVIGMDEGGRTPLGLIDDGPTGRASCTFQLDYQGPGRGCGNSINALLDAWLVSGCRGYLDRAEALIRRAVHPAADVAALGLLDVERRWSYTVFLAALARYLGVKAEGGELDASYAYARASLLTFAVWMLEHEEPYFDHPEKLEYPTETWAAQELRKANVLRLAARHADEPLCSRLLRRGDELAGRAWDDLLRFESRHVTRSLAILMVEGSRDAYFRGHPVEPAPRPSQVHDFGVPETFIPQKQRVLARLRTVRGLVRALAGLGSVTNWRKFLRLRRPGRPGPRPRASSGGRPPVRSRAC
jgi:hypothetical protein